MSYINLNEFFNSSILEVFFKFYFSENLNLLHFFLFFFILLFALIFSLFLEIIEFIVLLFPSYLGVKYLPLGFSGSSMYFIANYSLTGWLSMMYVCFSVYMIYCFFFKRSMLDNFISFINNSILFNFLKKQIKLHIYSNRRFRYLKYKLNIKLISLKNIYYSIKK